MSTEKRDDPINIAEQIQRRNAIQSLDNLSKFDVQELVGNPYGIRKLYEERTVAVAEKYHLQDRVKILEVQLKEFELQNQKLRIELRQSSDRSLPLFLISLSAVIIMGIGVNLVTSNENRELGMVLVILALIGELVIFLIRPKISKED